MLERVDDDDDDDLSIPLLITDTDSASKVYMGEWFYQIPIR